MPLMPVDEALTRVLANVKPLAREDVPLRQALGRVLTAEVVARRTQPPDAVSAMDGYAVHGADVVEAPVTLKLVGEVAAGHPFAGTVGVGEAARIFTGGVMPAGADTVVIQEVTRRERDSVVIDKPTAAGRNVRQQGLDFSDGVLLLRPGKRLTDRDIMLAAAMNHPTLPVHRRPRVAVLGTGDELVAPGSQPGPGEIVYSNGFALLAMAEFQGAEVLDLGIAPDHTEEIARAVWGARSWGADVLVTTGGASVGEHDLVQRALKEEGLDLDFWRVALRPGRPMIHGRIGALQVLGVPGNPVSAYVCAFLFLIPLLRRLAGRADVMHITQTAKLGCDLEANDERADYMRATLSEGPDGPVVTPLPNQDSSLIAPLSAADCLLIRPIRAPAAPAGSPCVILKLAH